MYNNNNICEYVNYQVIDDILVLIFFTIVLVLDDRVVKDRYTRYNFYGSLSN